MKNQFLETLKENYKKTLIISRIAWEKEIPFLDNPKATEEEKDKYLNFIK